MILVYMYVFYLRRSGGETGFSVKIYKQIPRN